MRWWYSMPSRERGTAAEQQALQFLRARGLQLVEANFRTRFGEIDLILRDGAVLVFAEVRMRASSAFGGAAGSITSPKQAKLIKTAQLYLSRFSKPPACRFDAVLLGAAEGATIEWIKDAFHAD